MKIPRILALGFLLTMPLGASASKPIALVYSLTGKASQGRHPVRLFDRLPSGAALKLDQGSRLELAFVNGRRYELGEGARVTLGTGDLSYRTGPVRPLPSVPPLPRLAPIAAVDRPGAKAGAMRIRAEEITGLYPDNEAATLAGATILRFNPIDGGLKYRVEVQDLQGNKIFEVETTASSVNIPAGVLRPGTRYGWTVRTIDREGPVAQGKADFVTLSADLERRLPYLQSPYRENPAQ
ncbi:MAG TPA: hypothetical protein VF789_05020 [Thermoanaerobaculia bacterium]